MKQFSYGVCPYKKEEDKVFILLNKTSRVSAWNFFKGKIEENESIEQCAQREFFEEAGILTLVSNYEEYYFQKNKRKDIGIFTLDVTGLDFKVVPHPREIWHYEWVELTDDVIMEKNQQQIYNKIKKDLT